MGYTDIRPSTWAHYGLRTFCGTQATWAKADIEPVGGRESHRNMTDAPCAKVRRPGCGREFVSLTGCVIFWSTLVYVRLSGNARVCFFTAIFEPTTGADCSSLCARHDCGHAATLDLRA